jgi:hypothetical protein
MDHLNGRNVLGHWTGTEWGRDINIFFRSVLFKFLTFCIIVPVLFFYMENNSFSVKLRKKMHLFSVWLSVKVYYLQLTRSSERSVEEGDINILTRAATTSFLFPILGSRSVQTRHCHNRFQIVGCFSISFSKAAAAVSFFLKKSRK